MKKTIFAFLACIVLAGCNEENDPPKEIELTGGTQTSQEVYADETSTANDIKFKAAAPWTATVAEAVTRVGGSNVEWLQLSAYEGEPGEQTLMLTLKVNTTGEDRKAEIKIVSGATVIAIGILQKSKTESGETPKPEKPEPSGSGTLTDETTGQSVKLTKASHFIESVDWVKIEFSGEKQYDDKIGKSGWFSVVFANPLENGRLKAGTYKVNFSGVSPHPDLKHGECYFSKSDIYYFQSGTIKVEVDKDTYKFTFDGVTIDDNHKIKGSFNGVPDFVSEEVKVTSVSLNEAQKTLEFGGSFALSATVLPENATDRRIKWSSSNTAIATVDENGIVKAVAAGKVIITATSNEGSKTATCEVTVTPAVVVQDIKVTPAKVSLLKGERYDNLVVTVLPENAYNKNYTWKSSNATVADYDGKAIEAKSEGAATITFTTEDQSKTATFEVTVTERQGQGSGNVKVVDTSGKYDEANYPLIEGIHTITAKNKVELSLKDDKGSGIVQLRFTNPLSNGRLAAGSYAISRSENPNNNTVVNYSMYSDLGYYESGVVAVSVSGDTYTITMTDIPTSNGRKITCSYTGKLTYANEYVDVASVMLDKTTLSLDLGKSAQLTATVNPANAFNKKVTWSSDNTSIVNVDQNGSVWASAVGTATITVTTEDRAKTASCVVTVNPLLETGDGTFSNNSGQSISVKRAEQWVNGKEPKEVDLRFYLASSLGADLSFTLVRGEGDTGRLKAGTYTATRLMADHLGVKYSDTSTGSVTVVVSGNQYTVTLDLTVDEVKITGTYTGEITSIQ